MAYCNIQAPELHSITDTIFKKIEKPINFAPGKTCKIEDIGTMTDVHNSAWYLCTY